MQPLLDVIDGYGGVASFSTLSAHGFASSDVSRAVKAGLLTSPRRRWWATSRAEPELVAAVRVGGHLTCVSALRRKGVWCVDDGLLHVAVGRNASHIAAPHDRSVRLTDPARHGVRLHRGTAVLLPGELDLAVDRVAPALRHLVVCQPREDVIVALDSALNSRFVGIYDVRAVIESLPKKYRHYLDLIDATAQSGLETKARLRLRALGIPYLTQVQIGTVGRVDLVVGERFVVELDSKAWHTSAQAYAEDRRRDLELIERGYIVLRVTYDQVMNQWSSVERAIRAVVRRNEHRWAARHRIAGLIPSDS
ncbi:DUF559 domain-containing protein [Agreia sp. PsM10]|uniref:endonuclease domain-containing protein n=1 Tax=Agreia sp. PsM10 TaxID=3030533 RepID=UPI00263B0CCB|nr:DUF559 domain-containing protein [Agreia sp. PsM10]MDN4640311.1 DUF559 domain-containing protein [Agreia sp. PsM10]